MSQGREHLVYEHLLHIDADEDGDKLHYADWVAQGMPSKSGKLPLYELEERVSHRLHCQRCGEPFESKRASAKYCTTKCRQRRPDLLPRPCLVCGQPLQPQHKDARYHPECRFRGYRAHQNIDSCASISRTQ
jgi:hypothetical protein